MAAIELAWAEYQLGDFTVERPANDSGQAPASTFDGEAAVT
ncbi:hypothetical protein I552_6270 [Mycobacterium xenopi 3993]|nr:hypothetical protein I552_6270 [Mycobacterium xenopi 3993]